MDKGLLTTSVANAQYQKLQQQQNEYQQYVVRKQQEMQEEQQVMLNQIMNAIAEFVQAYNVEKQYALILTTSGDILPAPVVTGSAALDITDEILAGLNAGHDLSLENLAYFVQTIPWTDEVSIGHAIICDALYMGLERTIAAYLAEIRKK